MSRSEFYAICLVTLIGGVVMAYMLGAVSPLSWFHLIALAPLLPLALLAWESGRGR